MGLLKREFNSTEKSLLVILFLIIFGGLYYVFVHTPIIDGMKTVRAEIEAAGAQRDALVLKVEDTKAMAAELEAMDNGETFISRMPSYDASKEELDFLNNTLNDTIDYYIGFSRVTRDGDQVRRGFSLQYKAGSYESAKKIMSELENSSIRCVVSDFSLNPVGAQSVLSGQVQVSATATFFETMVGGTPDNELPADTPAVAE
ncbi:MAG: hypothetical protein K6F00_03020 [Lachnospiraceae bacterium]|nr:hypothetical protein [Lachnospiraceae bacterium]